MQIATSKRRYVPESLLLALLLVACNLHLFTGGPVVTALQPRDLSLAQSWTLITHLFTHVSWYHLLIDVSALVGLYPLLAGGSRARLVLLGWCAVGSVLGTLADPTAWRLGMTGLSGVDHGLLAAVGIQQLVQSWRTQRRLSGFALVTLTIVFGKSIWEVTTGGVAFAGLHLGAIGTPVLLSHLGGALAGAAASIWGGGGEEGQGGEWGLPLEG